MRKSEEVIFQKNVSIEKLGKLVPWVMGYAKIPLIESRIPQWVSSHSLDIMKKLDAAGIKFSHLIDTSFQYEVIFISKTDSKRAKRMGIEEEYFDLR